MKANVKSKTIALIILLFAQTLVYQVSLPDLVLCVGDDGHIALEKGNDNGQCILHPSQIRVSHNEFVVLKPHQDADHCVDFVLDWHLSSIQLKHTIHQFQKISPSVIIVANLLTDPFTIRVGNNPDNKIARLHGVDILRSTILLI